MSKKINKTKTTVKSAVSTEKQILEVSPAEKIWKKVFLITAICMFFGIIILSTGAGNSGDEDGFQYPYAEKVVDFYSTFGADTACLQDIDMGMHGGWFDPLTVVIVRIFNICNYQTVRHIMNAVLGFLAILFAGFLAQKCKGWRAGAITMFLLFLSPRFLGHSFNNPKDLPFASMFIISIYYIFIFISEYPRPSLKTCIKLAVVLALAITSRIGGYLLFAYLGLFVFVYYLLVNKPKNYFSKQNFSIIKHLLFCYIGIMAGAFLLTIPLWPYIMEAPVANTIKAFTDLSHYTVSIRQNFEGMMQWSNALPWYYTPKYILISIPLAIIFGTILYLFVGGLKKTNRFTTFILYFSFVFPVFWIVYSKANVYGGWRHAMFAYPPMVVAAGLGFDALITFFKNKYLRIAATVLPFLLLLMPLTHIIKNHPYEYVYFNELAGGTKKAYGNYEMDYYYHSTRAASEWVIANAKKSGLETGDKIKVATWHTASVAYFFRKDTAKFEVGFSRWYERSNNDWDYAIFTITGMQPEQIKCQHFPPANTVHTITVDGIPICIVLQRKDKSDLKGYQYKSENQIDSAIYYFNKALEVDAYNEIVLINLIETYFQIGNLDSAKVYIDRVLDFLPSHETVNFYLAHYYMAKNQLDDALFVTQKMIKASPNNAQAHRIACDIYLRKNDIYSAEKALLKIMDAGAFDQNSANQLMAIYKAQGFDERVAQRKMFKHLAESFRKQGNKELAEQYEEASRR